MQNASLVVKLVLWRATEPVGTLCTGQDIVRGNAEAVQRLLDFVRSKFDKDFIYQQLLDRNGSLLFPWVL